MTWSKPFTNTEENKVSQYLSFSTSLFNISQAFSLYKILNFSRYSLLYIELCIISKSVFPNLGCDKSASFGIVISS